MRLREDVATAARFGADESGAITRPAWSPQLRDALEWLEGRFRETGLSVAVDGAGNVFGRAGEGAGRAILVGSHLDTVPSGGRFDGALGVLGGLAAVDLARSAGPALPRPVWVVAFMDEEGRFGASMVGSRAFVGAEVERFLAFEDDGGCRLEGAMSAMGVDPAELSRARGVDEICAYVELHVEQGPVLEQRGVDIGIVTGIVGLLQFRVRLRGQANHAGTTPMALRRDAFSGAARIALALRDEARGRQGVIVTVGTISVEPSAFNVIPGACSFSIDLRTEEDATFTEMEELTRRLVTTIAAEEGLDAEIEVLDRDPPVQLDRRMVAHLEAAAEAEGASAIRLPSGAGHDAMVVAPFVPTGMLFVPSRGGISHSRHEYTSPEDCERGARVLARALRLIASDPSLG